MQVAEWNPVSTMVVHGRLKQRYQSWGLRQHRSHTGLGLGLGPIAYFWSCFQHCCIPNEWQRCGRIM